MRKPTGEKPGRPPKAKSLAIRKRNARAQNLTPLQKRVVDTAIVKLKAPDWRDISPTELALASGAKKQTVFKWRRDAVIERYFNRRLSLKRARAKRLRTHHLTQRFIARLIKRDAERDGPRQRATAEIERDIKSNRKFITYHAYKNWEGPTLSLDGTKVIETYQEYADHILELFPDALPYEHVEEIKQNHAVDLARIEEEQRLSSTIERIRKTKYNK